MLKDDLFPQFRRKFRYLPPMDEASLIDPLRLGSIEEKLALQRHKAIANSIRSNGIGRTRGFHRAHELLDQSKGTVHGIAVFVFIGRQGVEEACNVLGHIKIAGVDEEFVQMHAATFDGGNQVKATAIRIKQLRRFECFVVDALKLPGVAQVGVAGRQGNLAQVPRPEPGPEGARGDAKATGSVIIGPAHIQVALALHVEIAV